MADGKTSSFFVIKTKKNDSHATRQDLPQNLSSRGLREQREQREQKQREMKAELGWVTIGAIGG